MVGPLSSHQDLQLKVLVPAFSLPAKILRTMLYSTVFWPIVDAAHVFEPLLSGQLFRERLHTNITTQGCP